MEKKISTGEAVKRVMREIGEFRTPSVLTPIMMIGEVVVETLIPLLMASIIDNGINKGDMKHILLVGGGMLILALTGLFFGVMGGVYGAKASTGFARNLRRAMFTNIETFSFSNIDRFSTSGLVTRLTTDVTNVQNAYQMMLRMFVRAPFSMIVAMTMAFIINARIASIYLGAVILLAIFLFFIMKRATSYFQKVFKQYDALNESVQENVNAIRVVKAYVREEYENDKFAKAAENVYNLFVRAENNVIINMPVMQGTVYAVILLISWVGAHMIIQNELTTGNLTSLLAYCMNILMSLMMLGMVFIMITMSSAAIERIAEVLNETTDIANPENGITEVPDGSIDFNHVNFSYRQGGGDWVLHDIDLHIKSGETIGVIGGTGSAKSSLVNLLSRLYDVQDGEVVVGGHNVR
ncbi:MAG: ABC transporter transmembrane domain-containing protein, partial [Lachnospiraceae bacterium]|nr:ABC transporter transmembrane domain-containing protein [Lachnospiraceae bacterium]